jgi:hypothetical protein
VRDDRSFPYWAIQKNGRNGSEDERNRWTDFLSLEYFEHERNGKWKLVVLILIYTVTAHFPVRNSMIRYNSEFEIGIVVGRKEGREETVSFWTSKTASS